MLLSLILATSSPLNAQPSPPDSVASSDTGAVELYRADDLAVSGAFDFLNTVRQTVPSIWVPQEQIAELNSGIRPFQLRGLSPDHTLVRIDGVRRHPTAAVQTAGQSMPGSSGVDLNAIPRPALERVVLREGGTTARYGTGAVAGVLDLELRDGLRPLTVDMHSGKHFPRWFDPDGWKGRVAANTGVEVPGVGGVLNLTGEYLRRMPTDRAGPSSRDQLREGDGDRLLQIDDDPLREVLSKRNPVPQPTFRIADGFYENRMVWANYERSMDEDGTPDANEEPVGTTESQELYLWGGWSDRTNRDYEFWRRALEPRNWPQIHPTGFLPTLDVDTRDVQVTAGLRGRWRSWAYDIHGSIARNRIDVGVTNTLNTSLGPCLSEPCAPGPDRELGTPDDPGVPNSTSFYAGSLEAGHELVSAAFSRQVDVGLPDPLSVSFGAEVRREMYRIVEGEPASYAVGWHANPYGGLSNPGTQGFAGWRPRGARADRRASVAAHGTVEGELFEGLVASAAGRLSGYEGIGVLGAADLALRYRPHPALELTLAGSPGYRVPGLATGSWTHVQKGFSVLGGPIGGVEVGEFSVDSRPARILGARPLDEERIRHLAGGMEVRPLEGLKLGMRGYFTRIRDGVALSGSLSGDRVKQKLAEIEDARIVSVRYAANVLDLAASGADLSAEYRAPMGAEHELGVSTRLHLNRVEVRGIDAPDALVPLGEADDFFGARGGGASTAETIDRIEHGRPSESGVASLRYQWQFVETVLRGRYFGDTEYLVRSPRSGPEVTDRWPSRTIVSAEIGVLFENGLEVSVGGDNLTDEMPAHTPYLDGPHPDAFDNIFWPGSPYPWVNGRYIYLSAEWSLD